jgi:hypothetical protein
VFGASGAIATPVPSGQVASLRPILVGAKERMGRTSLRARQLQRLAPIETLRSNVAHACTSAFSVALPKPGTYRSPLLVHRARDFDDPSAWVAALDASLLRVTTRTSLEEAAPRTNGPIGGHARERNSGFVFARTRQSDGRKIRRSTVISPCVENRNGAGVAPFRSNCATFSLQF